MLKAAIRHVGCQPLAPLRTENFSPSRCPDADPRARCSACRVPFLARCLFLGTVLLLLEHRTSACARHRDHSNCRFLMSRTDQSVTIKNLQFHHWAFLVFNLFVRCQCSFLRDRCSRIRPALCPSISFLPSSVVVGPVDRRTCCDHWLV